MSKYGNYHDTIPYTMLCNGEDIHFCLQWSLECFATAYSELKSASTSKNYSLLSECAKEYAYHHDNYNKWRNMANEVDRTR